MSSAWSDSDGDDKQQINLAWPSIKLILVSDGIGGLRLSNKTHYATRHVAVLDRSLLHSKRRSGRKTEVHFSY